MPTDIDDKQINEAQKLLKECMDTMQKTDGDKDGQENNKKEEGKDSNQPDDELFG